MNATATVTTMPKSNTPTFEDMLAEADRLGGLQGEGEDSQIKFLLKLVEGAYLGVFNLEKNRRGTNIDDAAAMSERYFKARNKGAIFNRDARNIQKLCSTHRRGIQFGRETRWGRSPSVLQMSNEYVEQWRQYRSELDSKSRRHPVSGKRLNDAFNAFQLFITAQMKSGSVLSKEERNALMWVKDTDAKTEMEKLDDIRKAIKKTGDASPQMQVAYDKVTERITNLVKGSR
jgi:hypothetical protein